MDIKKLHEHEKTSSTLKKYMNIKMLHEHEKLRMNINKLHENIKKFLNKKQTKWTQLSGNK